MTDRPKILLVDDEPEILEMFQGLLRDEGYSVQVAQSGDDAIELFKQDGADVVVTDIRMPGTSGLEVLRAVRELDDKVEVIVLTGHASVEMAISALKDDGAFDFLTKPLERIEDLLIPIEKAIVSRMLVQENEALLEELSRRQVELEQYNKMLRQAKRELELSRYRYQDLYDQAPVGYLSLDAQGRIKDVNRTAATLFGCRKRLIRGRFITEFIVPDQKTGKNDRAEELMDHIPSACEVQMRHSSGKAFYALLESLAIFKTDGSVDQVRMTISDISNQKQVELALIESEQRYRSFVENFKGIAFSLDEKGLPIFYHGAVEETIGYSEAELVGNRPGWEALIHPKELDMVRDRRRMLSVGENRAITHEYRMRHRNRQWRWVREHVQCLKPRDAQKPMLHGVVFDITEHKQLQSQYIESRKLDAIATMAAGIAHQFNNSLAGLMGNIELLNMDQGGDASIRQHTDPMMTLVHHMAELTKQLLAYARGGKYRPENLSAHDLVQQSVNLMTHRLSEHYDLSLELSAERDRVVADRTQMQMALVAVMENAIEAMPDGGTITVETRTKELKCETIKRDCTHPPGPYLSITIRDSGCGMTQGVAEKIFDPFFTTKFLGRGLGLSAAYGAVMNHNGWMEVDTLTDHGTQIHITLPLAKAQSSSSRAPGSGQIAKGDATVLVVEDEEMVLKAVHQLLDRLEYRVLDARTGYESLEILRTFSGQIDIVLLDVRLPDLDALELYGRMLAIRPELKVIACSGYDKDGPVEKLLESGVIAFLQKPFTMARLSAEIQAALRGNGKTGTDRKGHLRVI